MNSVRFHPEAETEMIEAAAWYEKQQADLGKRFLSTIQDSLNRIKINPLLFPVVVRTKRCVIKCVDGGLKDGDQFGY